MAGEAEYRDTKGIAKNLDRETYKRLYDATIVHEKPLSNALGDDFRDILTLERVVDIFKSM